MAYTTTNQNENAAFNMGVNTLMRIAEIIKQINMLNMAFSMGELDGRNFLGMKHMYVRQLLLAAAPLLKDATDEKQIRGRLDVVVLPTPHRHGLYASELTMVFPYNCHVDVELDAIVADIQNALQKQGGYLMPSSKDPKFSWKH